MRTRCKCARAAGPGLALLSADEAAAKGEPRIQLGQGLCLPRQGCCLGQGDGSEVPVPPPLVTAAPSGSVSFTSKGRSSRKY